MLAVDFQNTNQDNSHVLYSDSWGKKKLHWLSTYHTLLPDFQNTNQDNFLFFIYYVKWKVHIGNWYTQLQVFFYKYIPNYGFEPFIRYDDQKT